jgi:hypothetical protein
MEATAASATAAATRQGQQARTSAYRGVGWCKRTGKWYSSLRDKGHSRHLGYFATEGEAARAYDARARQLRGVVAWLNFPGEGERQGTAQQRVDPQAKAANVAAVATQQQCTSAYRGVTWSKDHGQWRAQIWHQERTQYLGHFTGEGEAARAYDARARQLRGVVAQLNFPGDGELAIKPAGQEALARAKARAKARAFARRRRGLCLSRAWRAWRACAFARSTQIGDWLWCRFDDDAPHEGEVVDPTPLRSP